MWTAVVETSLENCTLEERKKQKLSEIFEGTLISHFLVRWNTWWQTPEEFFRGKRGYLIDKLYPQLANELERMCQVVFHVLSLMLGWQRDVIGCEWKYWRACAHARALSLPCPKINLKWCICWSKYYLMVQSKLKNMLLPQQMLIY